MPSNTIRKKQMLDRVAFYVESEDEDATFNELMGKFDESYIYEKETDILSDDSDPTECASDLDTGQDGSDEYDTDDQLDIDYIDTGSTQEVFDKKQWNNTGSCTYFDQFAEKRMVSHKKTRKQNLGEENGPRRRKIMTRQRKRFGEDTHKHQTSIKTSNARESRSVGSTPVSVRRNKLNEHLT